MINDLKAQTACFTANGGQLTTTSDLAANPALISAIWAGPTAKVTFGSQASKGISGAVIHWKAKNVICISITSSIPL